MQKKLIALAIAGLSGAAFAQSNVTIYGVADLTQEYAKADSPTVANTQTAGRTRLATNSSYIGFKGAESLGNGLTAVFQFESSVNADQAGNTGNSLLGTGRDTYIGVAGGFGTVAAGTLTHPIRAMGAAVDFNPGASSAGFTGSTYGEVLGAKTGSDERANNAVAYISPNFGGFTGVVAYVNLENAQDSSQNTNNKSIKGHAWQIAGTYQNGPVYVSLGWDKHTDPNAVGALGGALTAFAPVTAAAAAGAAANGYNDSLTITRLAGKYTFATGTSVSALWDKQKYDLNANTVTTDVSRTAYALGVNQKFGASNVWLQYAVAKDVSGDLCSKATTLDARSCGDTGAKQWTLGYSYDLSKRTMVHALYTRISNDARVAYDHYVNGAAPTVGADTTVYGVGLRHSF